MMEVIEAEIYLSGAHITRRKTWCKETGVVIENSEIILLIMGWNKEIYENAKALLFIFSQFSHLKFSVCLNSYYFH